MNFSHLIKSINKCVDAPDPEINTKELLLKEFCYAMISTATYTTYLSFRRDYTYWTTKGIDIKVLKTLGSAIYALTQEYDNIYPCFPIKNKYINASIDALGKIGEEYHAFIFDFISKKDIDVRANEIDILIGAIRDTILSEERLHVRVLYIDGTSVLVPGTGGLYNIAKTIAEEHLRRRGSWCKTCQIGCNPVNIGIPPIRK